MKKREARAIDGGEEYFGTGSLRARVPFFL